MSQCMKLVLVSFTLIYSATCAFNSIVILMFARGTCALVFLGFSRSIQKSIGAIILEAIKNFSKVPLDRCSAYHPSDLPWLGVELKLNST